MHRGSRRFRILVTWALLAVAGFARATSIPLGAVQIELPAPGGAHEISEQLPGFRQMIESIVPVSNRLLALYAPDSVRNETNVARYMMVQSVKDFEGLDVSASDFASVAALSKAQMPSLDQAMKDAGNSAAQKVSEAVSQQTDANVDIKVGESKVLGAYADEKDWIGLSLMIAAQVTGDDEAAQPHSLICAANTIRVRSRILYVFVYSNYDSAADKSWTEATSRA